MSAVLKQPKPRKCKVCKGEFVGRNSLQTACGPLCAVVWLRQVQAKVAKRNHREQRAARREGLVKLRTVSDWTKLAQAMFNKFIRMRDADKPCISCGREHVEWTRGGSWDCGHFRSVGAAPELRFEELNAHKQCKSCNGGSGKYARKNHTVSAEYRVRLIERIGLAKVEWLEGPHESRHYRIDELIAIRDLHRRKAKELKA
jgi:hypothetical protein